MRKTTLNEHVKVALLLLGAICGQAACAGGTATMPDGLGRTYAGAWMGTTLEGTAIAFDVSAGNIVTNITIGRDNRGCRDAQTYSSLSLMIGESDVPGRVPMPAMLGQFSSTQAAQGTVAFLNFEKCGDTLAFWTATKR
jgi:hypothetical protein